MDITITVRGLEELGVGLSALAAALPEALRQFAALDRQSRTDAHAASVVTPESPAQSTHTPERPVSTQNATTPTVEAVHDTPPWPTAATPATDTTPMNTTPTHNATPPKQPTLEDVRAVLAQKSAEGRSSGIQALLVKYGAKKLSGVDPARYAELLRDAEVL